MSKFLLPYKFKYWGAFMFPLGLFGWYLIQLRIKYKFMLWVDDLPFPSVPILLTIFFFSGLFGLYFLLFSKEKKEDEYIRKIRLESFQFATLVQILSLTYSFIRLAFMKDPPRDHELMLFVKTLFVFWLCYIIRFNFIMLRNRLRIRNEK